MPLQRCVSFSFGRGASRSLRQERNAGVIGFFLHHTFATGSGNRAGPGPPHGELVRGEAARHIPSQGCTAQARSAGSSGASHISK